MLIMLGGGGGEGGKAFLSQIRKTGKGYLKRSGL